MRSLAILLTLLASPLTAQSAGDATNPDRITVQMMPGLTSSNQLPTQELINARKALAQGRSIYVSQMREIADYGDGFAAYRLADWLSENSDEPSYSDIAHYYGIAAATGRGGAIRKLIGALEQVERQDLPRARSNVLEGILFAYAEAGNTLAIDAVIRFQKSQRPFGRIDHETEALLKHLDGDAEIQLSLHLASVILQQPEATDYELQKAEAYLQTAMSSDSLEVQLIASNMMGLLQDIPTQIAQTSTEVAQ